MIIRLFVITLLFFSYLAIAQDWRDGLTELQQFRTYPYVDKAFLLNRQQRYEDAVSELEKALQVVPEHAPLIDILFDFQLSIPDTAAALTTYQRLPSSLRADKLRRIMQLQLENKMALPINTYLQLLPGISVTEQQHLLLVMSQHLVAEQKVQRAFDLLADQAELNSVLLLQRAALAQQLSLPRQVIKDTEAVPEQHLSEQDWQRYGMALLNQGHFQRAAVIANRYTGSDWSVVFYRQWLQMQIASSDWSGAEHSFTWLNQHTTLTQAEQQQRYQAAINSNNKTLASQLLETLSLDCLDKTGLYLQADSADKAKATFLSCPVQSSLKWLVYADRWLSADAIEQVSFDDAVLTTKKTSLVLQKRISEKNYHAILNRKFSQPLKQHDYSLLVNSINALQDTNQQLSYFLALYEAMPNEYLLDRLSYLYIELQHPAEALQLLIHALPFSAEVIEQKVLPERLLNLLQQQPNSVLPELLSRLDSWTVFPETRAELWRLAGYCERAMQILNTSPDSATGWTTLALCANDTEPGTAIQYWQQAQQLQPDVTYSKQIAYQYQKLQRPSLALLTWQAIPIEQLLAGDILTIAELALQQGQLEVASEYLQHVTSTIPEELARQHVIQAAVYRKKNQSEQMLNSLQKAVELQPQHPDYQLEYAYGLAATEPENARDIMQGVHTGGYQFTATQAAQFAYLNQRLLDLPQTQQWTKQALSMYAQQETLTDIEHTTQFSLLRLSQQLASYWQLSASSTFTSGAVIGERIAADEADLSRHGFAVKAEYFFDPLQQDLSLYAVIASNGNGSAWQTWGQQFGVSYKPLDDINFWLSAGLQQYPLGQGDWQSILRLTADMLNANPFQAEWRPIEDNWWERKIYLDAVWWPETGNKLAQIRFDQGRIWKISGLTAQTIKWYGLFQYDYRSQQTSLGRTASGNQLASGMGVQWRFWPGEVPAMLQQRRLEVNLEWQYQLIGSLNQREHALLLQFYLFW